MTKTTEYFSSPRDPVDSREQAEERADFLAEQGYEVRVERIRSDEYAVEYWREP